MASANDMKAAEKTYEGFIALLKWSVPAIALITAFVVFLIAS
ncbi:MAG: aa3-type cytochrome c oxidase subunit IV [Sphingomonadales bacterium]|nr:aa3-type cytochrome c oxidase subunit IV [Sphingomonadales bacterium]MBD3772816.1 aa3-type cytochrome c oxidase subunit IV [Paracoccaceae bacterium]